MSDSRIVTLFDWLDETTSMIQKKLDEPYLDSFALSLEALFYDDMPVVFTDDLRVYMTDMLQQMDLEPFSDDEKQKAIQLIILKGMQKTTQQQHVITPEAIALFIGYLANKLTGHQQTVRLFDPVSGTGNLLFTVMDAIHKETQAYASEVDGTLLKISLLFANILKKEVEFFHQDSLRPFLLDPVDLVIADLPVGYYPDDVQAAQFDMAVRQGHTYAHHLLIEQSLTYTKAGGYAIFIIPESLFDSEQSEQLHMFIQKQAHVIGLIQLSETTFKSKENRKSVFILRKKGARTKDVKQPLLAQLPSFKNTAAMEDIMGQLNGWFEEADLDTT
jgi:site-specific DNA-methyltransferase (adenine-specific)